MSEKKKEAALALISSRHLSWKHGKQYSCLQQVGREEGGRKELQPTALPELLGEALEGLSGLSGEATRSKQTPRKGN